MKKLILASASLRRKELLKKIGLQFNVEASNVDESISNQLDPHEAATLLSLQKARTVAERHKNTIVIGADTLIFCEGQFFGKPRTPKEAREILGHLSGRSHLVVTGLTVIDSDTNQTVSRSVATRVYMKQLMPEEIDAYIEKERPFDYAGAYAIQELGAIIVERVEGDFWNVVGLPLAELVNILKEFNIDVLEK